MKGIAALSVVTVFIVAAAPAAWGFHDLDCGPFRAEVVDEATGISRCLDPAPGTQRQFLRFRQLKLEQEKRTRELQLEQRQRAKAQALIRIQELTKQQGFNRRHMVRQRQSGLTAARSTNIQEGLLRQDQEAKRRGEEALASGLLRQRFQLEQQLALPRADLLDGQKALNLRLQKDQQRK